MSSSTYSSPERSLSEIASVISKTGIANVKPEDLAHPTAKAVFEIYTNFIRYVDPLADDVDGQISFSALEFLENPDQHVHSIPTLDLYVRVKEMLASIHNNSFTLADLLAPDPRRTHHILSSIVNFIYHRDNKLNLLQPFVDILSEQDDMRIELEKKIAQLNKEIMDHEAAREMEEPMVREVESEVKELKQTIQGYNKEHAALKNRSNALKEKMDTIEEKISRVDFELVQCAQENSDLSSRIVQSPDKLQRALELKKSNRAEVKNSERLAEQRVQEKTAILEVYSKAFEKMSKHLAQMQAIQEQVISAKTFDKDVKALKDKLSDEDVLIMTLEAKTAEWQRKAKHAEELIKATEKERDTRHAEDTQRVIAERIEAERKLKYSEVREKNLETLVAKGESLCLRADSVREAGKIEQHKLQAKLDEVIHAFHSYSEMMTASFQSVANEACRPE